MLNLSAPLVSEQGEDYKGADKFRMTWEIRENMPRLPEYLKRNIIDTDKTKNVRKILKENCLNTVCEGARCPNKNECYQKNTATFLIMGNVCTRNCRYCNISSAKPQPLDENEPKNLAKAVKELGLKYIVITSVTRDDLPDGGAGHFANCLKAICEMKGKEVILKSKIANHSAIQPFTYSPGIEILTPDFKGDTNAIDKIIKNIYPPEVFNHNIEVVESLFKTARPQGDYRTSLDVLKYVKENSDIKTKSGLMVGLGETWNEIKQTLVDLKDVSCDIITIGQYISPSKEHLSVEKYYSPDEFEQLRELTKKIGFKNYQIGPLVRSSYNASELTSSSS